MNTETIAFLVFLPLFLLFAYQMIRVGNIMRKVSSLKDFYENYDAKHYNFFTRLFFIQFDKTTFFYPWYKRTWDWTFQFLGDSLLTLWFKFCGYFFITFGIATAITWPILALVNFF